MLAQNFKSAADLGITEPQLDALRKTLVLAETGRLTYWDRTADAVCFFKPLESREFTGHFNMQSWSISHECGTACCIGGTAELVGGLKPFSLDEATKDNRELYELFYPQIAFSYNAITASQAATALRSYLTTGDARWDLAVA